MFLALNWVADKVLQAAADINLQWECKEENELLSPVSVQKELPSINKGTKNQLFHLWITKQLSWFIIFRFVV
jgi:hypothetical protein